NHARILDLLLLLLKHIVNDDPSERKGDPILEVVVFFHFVGAAVNHFAQFDIRNESEQENSALHTPQRVKRLIETIFVAVGGELAQEHGGQDFAFLDRDH